MPFLTPTLIDPTKVAYVVVDMETSGLSVHADFPLELGIGIYDDDLNELAMNSWLIRDEGWRSQLAKNEYVENMHVKNGLIADILSLPDEYYEVDAEGKQHTLDFSAHVVSLMSWRWLTNDCGLTPNKFPLTGSSVGSLDRSFLREFLSEVHHFFTYRDIDVSSLKELCKRHNPTLYSAMMKLPEFLDTNKKHRVRDDIRASVAELKFYIENFLKVQPRELAIDGQLEFPIDHPV